MISRLTVTTALAALVLAALAATASGSVRYDGLTASVVQHHSQSPAGQATAPELPNGVALRSEGSRASGQPVSGPPQSSSSESSSGDGFDWGYLAIAVAAASILGLLATVIGRQRSRSMRRPTPAPTS